MERKNGIDLFKFIGAFFIMCIHTEYGNLDPKYAGSIILIARWAVPFYFISTGYFLQFKIKKGLDLSRIEKNIGMLISILLIASFIYVPIGLMKGYAPSQVSNILTGSYFHLWFIGALLTGYIFIWYLHYIQKQFLLPFASVVLILVAIAADSYDVFFNEEVPFDLFRFLLAIPFMYIGILLSKMKTIKLNNFILLTIAGIGLIIQFIEAEYFLETFNMPLAVPQFLIGTSLFSIPLFIFSSKLKMKNNWLSDWGMKHSLFIYLYHPAVNVFLWLLIKKNLPNYHDSLQVFAPIIGFSLILLIALALNKYLPRAYRIMNGDLSK